MTDFVINKMIIISNNTLPNYLDKKIRFIQTGLHSDKTESINRKNQNYANHYFTYWLADVSGRF